MEVKLKLNVLTFTFFKTGKCKKINYGYQNEHKAQETQ